MEYRSPQGAFADCASEAILPIGAKTLAAYDSDNFLNAVVSNSFLVAESAGDAEAAKRKLRRILEKPTEVRGSGGLFKISLTETSCKRARDLLARVVGQVLEESKPTGSLLISILQQIEALESSIPELEKLSSRIAQNAKHIEDGMESEQFARAVAGLYNDISQKRLRLIELKRSLAGTHLDDGPAPDNWRARWRRPRGSCSHDSICSICLDGRILAGEG